MKFTTMDSGTISVLCLAQDFFLAAVSSVKAKDVKKERCAAHSTQMRLSRLFSIFTGVAIFIACLGLFGLASFTVEQRTKEIGIRKILGASISGIVIILSKEYVKWIVLANVLAWPAAYVVMNQWLKNFAYRTDVGISTFILSAVLALVIALLTVSYQSIKAALADPVESLRYE